MNPTRPTREEVEKWKRDAAEWGEKPSWCDLENLFDAYLELEAENAALRERVCRLVNYWRRTGPLKCQYEKVDDLMKPIMAGFTLSQTATGREENWLEKQIRQSHEDFETLPEWMKRGYEQRKREGE